MQKVSEWRGYTTSAYIGLDEWKEPKYAERRYYQCKDCRRKSAVQTPYCPQCGAKMAKTNTGGK